LSVFQRLVYFARVVLAGTSFLGAWIGAAVMAVVLFPVARLRHRREPAIERAAACQRWMQRAFVMLFDYMRLCRLIDFNARHVDKSLPGPRFVMVANHPTLVDHGALAAVFGRLVCVAMNVGNDVPAVGEQCLRDVPADALAGAGDDGGPFTHRGHSCLEPRREAIQ